MHTGIWASEKNKQQKPPDPLELELHAVVDCQYGNCNERRSSARTKITFYLSVVPRAHHSISNIELCLRLNYFVLCIIN